MDRESKHVYTEALQALPAAATSSVVEWAERNFRVTGSPKTEIFDRHTAPWLNTPLECASVPGRYSFVKPVQSGGTTLGEAVMSYCISTWMSGDLGIYWPNGEKADDRWAKYTNKRLKACVAVMARFSGDRSAWSNAHGLINFPHLNLSQLGVRTARNVSSDTLRGVICEELHDAANWTPGRLAQVFGRQTAVWNAVAYLISNASRVGDDFHTQFIEGTQEEWQVKCPGCGKFHRMHAAKYEDGSGLCYDADGCRKPDGTYDYTRLLPTIHYRAECGYKVQDTPQARRALSESGQYSAPHNPGALSNHRSFRLEAVACHDTRWVDLIQQKHLALRALKRGAGPGLLEVYQREQECIFWDARSARPDATPIVLSTRSKDRTGLPDRIYRLAAIDYQVGLAEANETAHFWCVVQDVSATQSLIVFEGKCNSEGELKDVLVRHEVKPNCTLIDASYAGTDKYVYNLALRHGWDAVKVLGSPNGQPRTFCDGPDKAPRLWTQPEFLYPHLPGQGPTRSDPNEESQFWSFSQAAALNALAYARASTERRYEIPADVSPEFLEHFKAWSLVEKRVPQTNEIQMVWQKSSDRAPDHCFMCCSYLAIWCDRLGVAGAAVPTPDAPQEPDEEQQQPEPQPVNFGGFSTF